MFQHQCITSVSKDYFERFFCTGYCKKVNMHYATMTFYSTSKLHDLTLNVCTPEIKRENWSGRRKAAKAVAIRWSDSLLKRRDDSRPRPCCKFPAVHAMQTKPKGSLAAMLNDLLVHTPEGQGPKRSKKYSQSKAAEFASVRYHCKPVFLDLVLPSWKATATSSFGVTNRGEAFASHPSGAPQSIGGREIHQRHVPPAHPGRASRFFNASRDESVMNTFGNILMLLYAYTLRF